MKCSRTICNVTQGVTWWNSSTRSYYCESCAKRINIANGDICFQLPNVTLPEGWQFNGFFIPLPSEHFLNHNDLAQGKVFIMAYQARLDPEVEEKRRWIVEQVRVPERQPA